MTKPHATRRQFLTGLVATAAAAVLPAGPALAAAPLPPLTLDDPTAKALGYVLTPAEAAKDPAFKKGSTCANCALYQAAQEQAGHAPCAATPGKSVARNAWCRAWVPKPA
jgi:FtsP/CotA-like multicopper oxidase with cupredoxin domain